MNMSAEPIAAQPKSDQPDSGNEGTSGSTKRFRDRLKGQSAVALVDQAIASGANFATVVIVGRAAGADALGVYSLGFTLLMLVAAAQEALVSSPYTFYGHRVNESERASLAGSSLIHALCLMILSATVLVSTAALMGASPTANVLWILAAMSPLILAREFARKFAFADLRMHVALGLDIVAAGCQIAGLCWLAYSGNLNASTAFIASGCACGIASLGWLVRDRKRFRIDRNRIASDWHSSWKFGRWVFAGVVTILVHINVVRWLIAFGIDNSAAGVFAACMAIAMLSTPFIQGMNNVLIPRAAQAFHTDGRAAVRRVVRQTTLLVLSGMAVFSLLTFIFGGWAVTLIYGADYAGNHMVICLLVLFMVSRAIDTSLYNGIWALERPAANVRINIVALTATIVLASSMMSLWGTVGAACGLLLGDICGTGLRGLKFMSLVAETASVDLPLEMGAEELGAEC